MKKKTLYIGIVMISALLILFLVSIFMNKIRFGSSGNFVLLKFNDINGLRVNDEVRLRGVKTGSVKSIDLLSDYVLVKIEMKNKHKIPSNSIAGIHDYAVIGGTKYIMLYPGKGIDYIFPSDTLKGENYDFSIARAAILLNDIKIMIEEAIPSKEAISSIMDSLNAAINGVNDVIHTTGKGVSEITENINTASKTLNQLMDTLSVSLNIIKSELSVYNENDNSLKSLTSDNEMYLRIEKSIRKLEIVIDDMSKNRLIKGCF